MGGGFSLLATLFTADQLSGRVVRRDVEPTRERRVVAERRRISRQRDEHLLGDVICRVGIAADATQGRGPDQRQMAVNQIGEGGF